VGNTPPILSAWPNGDSIPPDVHLSALRSTKGYVLKAYELHGTLAPGLKTTFYGQCNGPALLSHSDRKLPMGLQEYWLKST